MTGSAFPKPGVRRAQLRPCACCARPLLNRPGFKSLQAYRLTIDSLMLDARALQQHAGLAMLFGGNEGLAAVFAPDDELLKCYASETVVVCQECYFSRPAVAIAEAVEARRAATEAGGDSEGVSE